MKWDSDPKNLQLGPAWPLNPSWMCSLRNRKNRGVVEPIGPILECVWPSVRGDTCLRQVIPLNQTHKASPGTAGEGCFPVMSNVSNGCLVPVRPV